MSAWREVKAGDTVTITRTFTVERVDTSGWSGRSLIYDADFRTYAENEGLELVINRADPWHDVADAFGIYGKCGCSMGRNHTNDEYTAHFRHAKAATHE